MYADFFECVFVENGSYKETVAATSMVVPFAVTDGCLMPQKVPTLNRFFCLILSLCGSHRMYLYYYKHGHVHLCRRTNLLV